MWTLEKCKPAEQMLQKKSCWRTEGTNLNFLHASACTHLLPELQLSQQSYSSRTIYSSIKIFEGPHHHITFLSQNVLGASLKHKSVHSSGNTSLPNLRLQAVSQRYLWSLLHPAKYLQGSLEQMWHLWQNPQVHFVSTHGKAFASISIGPGNLWCLPFPILNLRCCLTTSFPHPFCPFTREQLLSSLPLLMQTKLGRLDAAA